METQRALVERDGLFEIIYVDVDQQLHAGR